MILNFDVKVSCGVGGVCISKFRCVFFRSELLEEGGGVPWARVLCGCTACGVRANATLTATP